MKELICSYEDRLGLEGLEPADQLDQLNKAQQLLCKETAAFSPQAIVACAMANRKFITVTNEVRPLTKVEEEEKGLQACLLLMKGALLARLSREVQGRLPLFTLTGYWQSQPNEAFYRYHQQPWGVSNSDYDRMVGSQEQLQGDCVESMNLRMRSNFRNAFSGEEKGRMGAAAELNRLEKVLDPRSCESDEEFARHLGMLKGLSTFELPVKIKTLHRSCQAFLEHPVQVFRCIPDEWMQTLENIGRQQLPGGELFCRALARYRKWLMGLVDGSIAPDEDLEVITNLLFDDTVEEGHQKADDLIYQWVSNHRGITQKDKLYAPLISGLLFKVKAIGDQLKVGDYYHYMEELETVKCLFVHHCWESRNLEFQRRELSNAVMVHEVVRFVNDQLVTLGKETVADEEILLRAVRDASGVLAFMAPDELLAQQMIETHAKVLSDWHNRKPAVFIFQDIESRFQQLYNQAEGRLMDLFRELTYRPAITYALKVIHEIDLVEIKAAGEGKAIHKNFFRLRRMLSRQAKYLLALHHAGLPEGQLQTAAQLNILQQLTRIIHLLNDRIHLLMDPSMTDLLAQVLLMKNIEQFKGTFEVGCHTVELKYFLEKAKIYNPAITWKAVDGIFISRNGVTLSSHAINSHSTERMNSLQGINRIFRSEE